MLPTLAQALFGVMQDKALLGWTRGRTGISIERGEATLRIGWLADTGFVEAEADNPDPLTDIVDAHNMPRGVTCRVWSAPPDDIIRIAIPTDADVLAVAQKLGMSYVDRGNCDDRIVYWLGSGRRDPRTGREIAR